MLPLASALISIGKSMLYARGRMQPHAWCLPRPLTCSVGSRCTCTLAPHRAYGARCLQAVCEGTTPKGVSFAGQRALDLQAGPPGLVDLQPPHPSPPPLPWAVAVVPAAQAHSPQTHLIIDSSGSQVPCTRTPRLLLMTSPLLVSLLHTQPDNHTHCVRVRTVRPGRQGRLKGTPVRRSWAQDASH